MCRHPRLDDIHRALDAGEGLRAVARAFQTSPQSLTRHKPHRIASPSPAPPAGDPAPPAPAEAKAAPNSPRAEPAPEGRREGDELDEPREPPDVGAAIGTTAGGLLQRMRQLELTADKLRTEAESPGMTLRDRGQALGEARRTVESMAKIATALSKSREMAVLESEEWARIRSVVIETLRPFPEARVALLEGLRRYAEDA